MFPISLWFYLILFLSIRMCIDSYVSSMLLWKECLYKMQSVALLNCGLLYHCLAWNCCHVWMWPQEKRELLEYQGTRFAKHWIIHTVCCMSVPLTCRLQRIPFYLCCLLHYADHISASSWEEVLVMGPWGPHDIWTGTMHVHTVIISVHALMLSATVF